MRKYGDEALKDHLLGNPAKYLTLLNTIATLANASVNLEKQRLSAEAHTRLSVSNQIKPDQDSRAIVAVRFQRAGEGGSLPPVPAQPESTQFKVTQAPAKLDNAIHPGGPAGTSKLSTLNPPLST